MGKIVSGRFNDPKVHRVIFEKAVWGAVEKGWMTSSKGRELLREYGGKVKE
jgi:hypothetical protein